MRAIPYVLRSPLSSLSFLLLFGTTKRGKSPFHSSVRSANCSMLPVTRSSSAGAPAYVTLARNGDRYRIRPLCRLSVPASFLPSSRPSRPFNVLARSLPSPSLGLSLRHSIRGGSGEKRSCPKAPQQTLFSLSFSRSRSLFIRTKALLAVAVRPSVRRPSLVLKKVSWLRSRGGEKN